MIKRFLGVFIALAIALTGLHADRRPLMIDSLELRLQHINTSRDSVSTLLDILDLSTGNEARMEVASRVYDAAVNAGDTMAQIESILYMSNLSQRDTAMLATLSDRIGAYPPTDRVREVDLFIDMLRLENEIRNDTARTAREQISQLIQDFSSAPPEDPYERAKMLYSVCSHLSTATRGDLLETYIDKIDRLVESMPLPMGAVRNLVYTRAAPVFTNNGSPARAVEIDKKTLNIIDSMSVAYAARGRKYRRLEHNRYNCYRRMLGNYQALTSTEIESYHRSILNLAEKNSWVAADLAANPRADAFYYMATKRYPEAIDAIKKALLRPENQSYEFYLYNALFEAAKATGDRQTQLDAAIELNELLREQIDDKAGERYRELQIIYDVGELQAENTELEQSRQSAALRNTYVVIVISALALLLLLGMMGMLARQYRKMKRMASDLKETADRLRNERNQLRKAQEELIEARDKAKSADRMKAEFINNMSHEIKTPLAAVAEYTRLIVDCIPDDKRNYLERFASIIDLNTKLVLTLMNDVLDIASLEHGNMTVTAEPTTARQIAMVALDSVFENELSRKPGVKVLFNTSNAPDVAVTTDSQRAVQILTNLLSNAEKFTDKGSIVLNYEVSPDGKHLVYSVTDTGIGIPDGKEEKIFERFNQLDNSASGCGLGLYITRLLARLLGAEVKLDTSYHKGARFIFSLPL